MTKTTTIILGLSDLAKQQRLPGAIGTKVIDPEGLDGLIVEGIAMHDPTNDQAPGQHGVKLPEQANQAVSAGVGLREGTTADDYVIRDWRDNVQLFLRREKALPCSGVLAIVYTREAYAADPQVTEERMAELPDGCTHVLVTVLGFAGPNPELSPHRFVANLAGGNNNTAELTGDEIREQAKAILAYDEQFCVVAD